MLLCTMLVLRLTCLGDLLDMLLCTMLVLLLTCLGDFLDMHEVTHLSKDTPIEEVVVQEFRDHFRSPENVGTLYYY